MIPPKHDVWPEGASESFRRDERGLITRVTHALRSLVSFASPTLDVVDVYHGNAISDASKLPHLSGYMTKLAEGATYQDATGAQRITMWQQMGIGHILGYLWLRSDSSVQLQFENFRKAIGRTTLVDSHGALVRGAGLGIDWERTYQNATTSIPDPSRAMVEELCGLIGVEYGRERQIVYSADWVTQFKSWRAANPDVALWYANYSAAGMAVAKGYGATMLQYTSSAIVPGFTRPVDASTRLLPVEFDRVCGIMAAPPPPVVVIPPTPAYQELSDDMANIGVVHLEDAGAEFLVTFVGPIQGPRILEAHWINTAAKIAAAREHINAGAAVFGHFQGMAPSIGAAKLVKANFKNVFVDILPSGDSVPWTWDDVQNPNF